MIAEESTALPKVTELWMTKDLALILSGIWAL